jgi:hypothetical protein
LHFFRDHLKTPSFSLAAGHEKIIDHKFEELTPEANPVGTGKGEGMEKGWFAAFQPASKSH